MWRLYPPWTLDIQCAELDAVKQSHCCLTLRFSEPREKPPTLPGVLSWQGSGLEWSAVCFGSRETFAEAVAGELEPASSPSRAPSLEEVFVAQVGSSVVKAIED